MSKDPIPRRRKTRPTSVSDVVASLVAGKLDGRPANAGRGRLTLRVFRAFEQLGPPITSHAEPASFRAGALMLVVDDPTWLTELSFLRTEILARFAAILKEPVVQEIRMRLGTLSARRPKPKTKAEPPKVSPEDARVIAEWAKMIERPEVREAMERAARWAMAKRRR